MKDSHFTCESSSILTRTCIKPSPVAFALHLSVDGSATYSSSGKFLFDAAVGGSHEALAIGGNLGIGCWGPSACVRSAATGRGTTSPRASRLCAASFSSLQLGGNLFR